MGRGGEVEGLRVRRGARGHLGEEEVELERVAAEGLPAERAESGLGGGGLGEVDGAAREAGPGRTRISR